MTKQEAIAQVDALLPNTCPQTLKELWVERVEQQADREVIRTHAATAAPAAGQLSIPAPYDECYIRYLEAQIHYTHGEMTRYGNAMAMFQAVYGSYCAWYNRHFLPLSAEKKEGKPCATPPI